MAVKTLSKPKKINKSKLKLKCDQLASAYYRRQTPYCELAGKDFIHCGGGLQWMHLVSRSALCIRYEPFNKLIGCAGHHVFYTHNPIDWVRFLEKHFPDRLAEAEAHRWDLTKPDYLALIEKFQTGLAALAMKDEYGETFRQLAGN